ncbi:AMP-binding protein [Mesorhizobium sp. WSM2561]|uniref:AMP-binding protein n=1 Tax=Mesorhizobium sp. WSM2561 TaxID=1040985 RepID=UPI0004B17725|nr:AMP-binding protein [Mesorhizobium sp. WSM2561]
MFFSLNHLREFGTAPCLVHEGVLTSYAELADIAERTARRLPSERRLVAVEMDLTPAAIAAYLGALSAGHAVMPLPAREPELARRMEERFSPAVSWRTMGDRRRFLFHDRPAAIHPDLALLLQTSGSTGQARGVRLPASAVQANAVAIANYLRLTPSDRAALVLPLHYSYGLSVLHSHLFSGASLWLADGSILDPGFATALKDSGAGSLAGVPHHFTLLESIDLTDALPETLRCLTVAGGAMKPAAVLRWAEIMKQRQGRFIVMYGQTEATARIAYLPPELAASHPDAVGQAVPGGTLLLRDGSGRDIAEAETEGELIYRGPNVMMGYAESAADLTKGRELIELATGDVARRGADGLYRITGRLSRMSKIAGLRIGHDALEQALAKAGHEVAVWGNDETIWIADSEPAGDLTAKAAQLAGVGAQHISVISCTEIPRHANGKIDYPALKKLEKPPIEREDVLSAFAETFAHRQVSLQDSFSSLGGDSLQHVELSLVLDRRLGGLPDHWEQLNIERLEQASPKKSAGVVMPVLARALAILAVVVAHQTSWPVYGGAAAMVLLLGTSVAQHRRQALIEWNAADFLKPVLRILVPYALVLAGFALAWGQTPWASVFLVANFGLTTPETHLMLPYLYWFIEAYVQMTLLVLLLFSPRRMRRLLDTHPFAAGLALLGFAFVLRLIPELWPIDAGRSQFTVPGVFYLFALGWCVACADRAGPRALALAAAAIILPTAAYLGGNWYGGWIKHLGLLVLVALLIYVPRVPLPRLAVRGVMYLAQAAFPVYLLHRLVPEVLMPLTGFNLSPAATDILAILGGIALGLVAAVIQRRFGRVPFRTPIPEQFGAQALITRP